jgi:hypothetical protein
MASLQEVATKVLSDRKFAQSLLNDPERVLRQEGIEPTAEMLAALKDISVEEMEKLAAAFNNDDKAM